MDRKQKRHARVTTLQVIYAYESSQVKPTSMISHLATEFKMSLTDPILKYTKMLADLSIEHSDETDQIIVAHSKNWDFNRIALIDRLILRIALSEMLYVSDIPLKVSISEGVEIAKEYSTDDSGGFVNGILDAVYNNIVKGKVA